MIHNNISSVGHIALQVPDLEQGLEFFRDLLGFKVRYTFNFDGYRIVILSAGKIEIEIWASKGENPRLPGEHEYGMHHLAIQVKDIEAVLAYLKKVGTPVLQDLYEPTRGIKEAIIQGPEGIRVQFVEQNVPLLIWRTIKGDFREN